MRDIGSEALIAMRREARAIDVSIVMPCLDEVESLPHCIANALDALARIDAQFGLLGEVVIADNGSTDGSQALAEALGARVVPVAERGYGAAIIGGCQGAFGQYLLIGDADGSYDFTDGVAMIGRLANGADLCMGSRFQGGVAPGAMPWKNRYIGNPALTGMLNLFFNARIDDAHCGLRAIRKEALLNLDLSSPGMEFASEMVIKASLRRLHIAEVPATLSVDLRNRAPHLRPWRDGWRHLRYLFMLSPNTVFIFPGAIATMLSLAILAMAMLHAIMPHALFDLPVGMFGNYWQVAASAMGAIGHQALIFGLAAHLHGMREGYRPLGPHVKPLARYVSLETMLVSGLGLLLIGGLMLVSTIWSWTLRDFGSTYSVLPAVVGTLLVVLGTQNVFGGFLLSIIGGNKAQFFDPKTTCSVKPPRC
jgi:hypothetical protein